MPSDLDEATEEASCLQVWELAAQLDVLYSWLHSTADCTAGCTECTAQELNAIEETLEQLAGFVGLLWPWGLWCRSLQLRHGVRPA